MNAPAAFNTLPGMSPGVYSEADFIAVRDLVHREAGIVLPEGKAMLVYSRLAPLVRACGSGTFAAYVKLLDKDDAERHRAICALTTNHTAFYREGHHFMHFDGRVRERPVARALRLARGLFGEEPGGASLFSARLTARDGWGRPTRPLLRFGFYVRSHLLRMPPRLLAAHLLTKWRKRHSGL